MRSAATIAAALVLALAGCGGGDKKKDANTSATPVGAAQVQQAQRQQQASCRDVAAPAPKQDGGQKKPTGKLDPGKTYDLVLHTSCGSFTIEIDQKQSPKAAASLVALAGKGFFDNTTFHRIVPGFVIQGGDPTGTGTGGPGYTTVDKPPSDARYTKGVVAMAKAGNEPPGAAGSQFYVVTGADAGLPPDYAIVGKVTSGQDVVDRIGELGDPASGDQGTPVKPVVIETLKVGEH